eukprot:g25863.t1
MGYLEYISQDYPTVQVGRVSGDASVAKMAFTMKTLKNCVEAIIGRTISTVDFFQGTQSISEEFAKLKKEYFKKVLVAHPDKGGDPAVFRELRTSWEVLREAFEKEEVTSFAALSAQAAEGYDKIYTDLDDLPTQPYEYYAAAAEEPVPGYRVELAKSGRSECKAQAGKKCGTHAAILQGSVRIGWLDPHSGSYNRWCHLVCWRVPSKIWLGIYKCLPDSRQVASTLEKMNEVLFSGYAELPPMARAQLGELSVAYRNEDDK